MSTSSPQPQDSDRRAPGLYRRMLEHPMAADLLMVVLLVGGLIMSGMIKQEVFPEVDLDEIRINLSYPGSTPRDVERSVVAPIEESIRNIPGVKSVESYSKEGGGRITVEVMPSVRQASVLNEVQTSVEGVSSLPDGLERPTVNLRTNKTEVLTLVVHGDAPEATVRNLAAQMRDDLLADPDLTRVRLLGMRRPEIAVEIPGVELRSHGLTLEDVADAIGDAAVEKPGGGIRTLRGEVLVRTDERKDQAHEFEDIVVLSEPDGSMIRLGDVAQIRDTFQELNRETFFDGRRAARVKVYRIGDQSPVDVSAAVHRYLDKNADSLPPGIEVDVWADRSVEFQERIDLLLENAYVGLLLVLLVVGLFLQVRLAFWVTVSIPIAIVGSFMLFPVFGLSFNMITLFALLLTLGIVVDDAIVVGEAIYKHVEEGKTSLQAALAGISDVAVPILVSMLTTVIVFVPILAIPGMSGKLYGVIPLVVLLVLIMSIIEALFILPTHVSRGGAAYEHGIFRKIAKLQSRFDEKLNAFVDERFEPALEWALHHRYFVNAAAIFSLLVATSLATGGWIPFEFMPKVEGDVAQVDIRLPFGTDASHTRAVAERVRERLGDALDEVAGERADEVNRGVLTELGRGASDSGPIGNSPGARSHLARVSVFLATASERDFTTSELTAAWREKVGEVAGVESMLYGYASGPTAGAPIAIELSHSDSEMLDAAAGQLADELAKLDGVTDTDSGVSKGKEQLNIKLRPNARRVGLTEAAVADQLRASFFGVEAVRLQRGIDELRVYVRRPRAERSTEQTLEQMLLTTPDGGEVPLSEVATLERGRSFVTIYRNNGRKVVQVTAAIEDGKTTGNEVVSALAAGPLPELVSRYPGLTWGLGDELREQQDVLSALGPWIALALLVMYLLLSFTLRSYIEPLVVMYAIPFGLIGALIGHVLLGHGFSFMSIMGIVAVSGIVVNASILLVVTINSYHSDGRPLLEAIVAGARRRFRPILLTSTTTFAGIMPLIFETSVQARFLVPMAISIGFGVLFSAAICMFLVPVALLIVDDIRGAVEARRSASR